MTMFDIEESGAERAPLRARLVAEADVIAITPPPTLAVREAGARRGRRRRALQATSGVVVVCGIATAAVVWAPQKSASVPAGTVTVSGGASSRGAVSTPSDPSAPSSSWVPAPVLDLPGYVHATDLGSGWVGPAVIPEGNISPTLSSLLTCAAHEGHATSAQPVQQPVFRVFNRTNYVISLVEAVYQYPVGEAAEVMGVIHATAGLNCWGPGQVVQGSGPLGDDSVVFGQGPEWANAQRRLILIRSGDRIAFVSISGSQTTADRGQSPDAIAHEIAARLTGS